MKATDTDILELEEFSASSFMGISNDSTVLIDFTQRRKGQNITEFIGDGHTGKSSRLYGILYAMGARFNLEKKQLINLIDGKLEEGLKFKWNGIRYHVIVTTSRVEVKKYNEGADKWTKIDDEPMTFLREVFGPVGLSPFEVRNLKGSKQIEYFQSMFGSGDDASKQMQKLEADYDLKFGSRRDINRDAKQLSSALEIEPLYQNREESEKKFSKVVSAEKEQRNYKEKEKNNADYERYKANLDLLKAGLSGTQKTIERLKMELVAAEAEEKETAERILKGNKWMEDNKNVAKEYETAKKEWVALSQTLADQEKWKDILRREKIFNEKTDQSTTLTAELDEINEKILKLTKKFIPKVEGLEIKVAVGIDKNGKEEGVFYQGKSISILSESEYVELWCLIFDAAGMNVIVVENLSSMGSDAVKTLNLLAKNGAQIFATKVDRAQKEVKVVFTSKVE